MAIPSVGFLGNSITSFLAAPKKSDYNKLTSLLEPSHYSDSNLSFIITNKASGNTASNLVFNNFKQNGGPIVLTATTLTLPGGNSINMMTQSGQGGNETAVIATSLLADQMLSLAEEMEADGAPSDLIALLKASAQLGHQLANAEESWNTLCTDPANCSTNPNTGGNPNKEVYDAHWLFTDTASQLLTKFKVDYSTELATSPVMQNFFDQSHFYTAGIDEVGGALYSTQVATAIGKVDAFGQPQTPSTNSSLPLDTSGITLDIAPQFTEATSKRLGKAQQEALETALASP